jgi:hypothetical protein
VEGRINKRNAKEHTMMKKKLANENGIALITALLISVAIMALVLGVLYFIMQSTSMSGAGNAVPAAAADGQKLKDSINMTMWGEPIANVFRQLSCHAIQTRGVHVPPPFHSFRSGAVTPLP